MKWNEQLKHLRNIQGWSQTSLGKKLGTSTHTISRWERGNAFPSPFYRERISQLFEKSLEELGLVPDVEGNYSQSNLVSELEDYHSQPNLVSALENYNTQPSLVSELENCNLHPEWILPDLEQGHDEDSPRKNLFSMGSETNVKPLIDVSHSQAGKMFTTTFWLGFALSGIVSLTAAIIMRQAK